MTSRLTDAAAQPAPADVWESVAACSAVGLNFWSHGPEHDTLWALDGNRRPHLLCVDTANGEVQAVCDRIDAAADEHHASCAFARGRKAYRVADHSGTALSLFESATAPQVLGA